jgi:hypothetical protein
MAFATRRGYAPDIKKRPMNKILQTVMLILAVWTPYVGQSQVGGRTIYNFLRLPSSARITALGGSLITVRDEDLANAVLNPAVLNKEMHGGITFQNNFYFDGIYNGYVAYAHYIEKWGITTHAGVQFMQYGDFKLADEFGNVIGTFKANEMALTVGASKEIGDRISAGVNLRFINSNLESYNSFAIAADIGAIYWDPVRRLTASFVIRNVGAQLSKYDDVSENLPLDIQLGFSKRLQHLPFRVSIIAHSLNQWNLRYESPLSDDGAILIGEDPQEKSGFNKGVDNLFRHFIFSGEFLLGKKEVVKLRVGYNHQRRKELTVGSLRSLAGFSGGIGIRIKQFSIDYGFGSYHIVGSTQHVGISTHISRFKEKTTTIVD